MNIVFCEITYMALYFKIQSLEYSSWVQFTVDIYPSTLIVPSSYKFSGSINMSLKSDSTGMQRNLGFYAKESAVL